MMMADNITPTSAFATTPGNGFDDGPKKEFRFPKWKRVNGDVHIARNYDVQYDLLAIEEFLNSMLDCGWRVVSIRSGALFGFVPCQPGEFICRTISSVNKRGSFDRNKAAELADLLTAEGAFIIAQERTLGTQMGLVALRPAALGPFEIVSDLDSRIQEFEVRRKYARLFGYLFFAVGLVQIASGLISTLATGDFSVFFGTSVVWFVLGSYYIAPLSRYNKILRNLYAARDVSES